MDSNGIAFAELHASADWACVEFISDLHLDPREPATFAAWQAYLATTQADAVFILGDLFEVWVGDDAANADASPPGFEAQCAAVLAAAAKQRPVYFLHGNRDFLVGEQFFRQTTVRCLSDPTVLCFGGARYLLSHGDALCLGDVEYQVFRNEVRSPAWQRDFLARPLAQRKAIARDIRTRSEAKKRGQALGDWHDLDTPMVKQWLLAARAGTLIHGHTHQPAEHDLGDGQQRVVLSDWDLAAQPPRAQVLQLIREGTATMDEASRQPPPRLQRINRP